MTEEIADDHDGQQPGAARTSPSRSASTTPSAVGENSRHGRRRRRRQRRQPHDRRRASLGVEFLAANTDCQALRSSRAPMKLQLGMKLTKGLGAGANPEVGKSAAHRGHGSRSCRRSTAPTWCSSRRGWAAERERAPLRSSRSSRAESGALVVAVVTKPFAFEGRRRRLQADEGLAALRQVVDTVITIPNDKLLHTVEKGTPLAEGVPDGGRHPAAGGSGDLGPHHGARRDQPRLRRRQDDHVRAWAWR